MSQFENDAEHLAYLGTDGQKWAEDFIEAGWSTPPPSSFSAAVTSWFANAIEAGRTAGFSALYEEMKHAARNLGLEDTSEIYTPGQLIEAVYNMIPEDHRCL